MGGGNTCFIDLIYIEEKIMRFGRKKMAFLVICNRRSTVKLQTKHSGIIHNSLTVFNVRTTKKEVIDARENSSVKLNNKNLFHVQCNSENCTNIWFTLKLDFH